MSCDLVDVFYLNKKMIFRKDATNKNEHVITLIFLSILSRRKKNTAIISIKDSVIKSGVKHTDSY